MTKTIVDPTFQLTGQYGSPFGLSLTIGGSQVELDDELLQYILIEIDGHATITSSLGPADQIGMTLNGKTYLFSNELWMRLVDEVSSAAGQGGWNPKFG